MAPLQAGIEGVSHYGNQPPTFLLALLVSSMSAGGSVKMDESVANVRHNISVYYDIRSHLKLLHQRTEQE